MVQWLHLLMMQKTVLQLGFSQPINFYWKSYKCLVIRSTKWKQRHSSAGKNNEASNHTNKSPQNINKAQSSTNSLLPRSSSYVKHYEKRRHPSGSSINSTQNIYWFWLSSAARGCEVAPFQSSGWRCFPLYSAHWEAGGVDQTNWILCFCSHRSVEVKRITYLGHLLVCNNVFVK